jgi:hypothetical protein
VIEASDWQAVYRELIAEGRRRLGEPPTVEDLDAYSRGELSAEEADRIGELLACYPELLTAVAARFPDSDEPSPDDLAPLTPEEQAEDWAEIVRRASLEPAAAPPASPPAAVPAPSPAAEVARDMAAIRPIQPVRPIRPIRDVRPAGRRWPAWPLPAAAATAALLALVFAGLYMRTLDEVRRLTRALEMPRLPEHRLLLPDGVRGARQPIIVLPAKRDSFLLAPALIHQPDFPDYRLAILQGTGSAGKTMWSASGLERQPGDTVEVWVPRSCLGSGPYQLQLYGRGAGPDKLLATYTFQLAE